PTTPWGVFLNPAFGYPPTPWGVFLNPASGYPPTPWGVPRVWLAPECIRELRQLVRHRDAFTRDRRSTKQRIGAVLRQHRVPAPPGVRRWTKAWIQWAASIQTIGEHSRWVIQEGLAHLAYLEARIRAVEARLREATRADSMCERLMAMPGIGEVTAWVIRAEIGRFDRFRTGKQLARFCGLSPRNVSSGDRQAQAGIIKAGSPMLRAILIEAAHRLIRHSSRWAAMAARLRAAGKKTCVAVAAVANRWIRWLFNDMRPLAG
ncbi:MAG: IS110 family transposase, partial [Phycisphaerales bacterium JB039]